MRPKSHSRGRVPARRNSKVKQAELPVRRARRASSPKNSRKFWRRRRSQQSVSAGPVNSKRSNSKVDLESQLPLKKDVPNVVKLRKKRLRRGSLVTNVTSNKSVQNPLVKRTKRRHRRASNSGSFSEILSGWTTQDILWCVAGGVLLLSGLIWICLHTNSRTNEAAAARAGTGDSVVQKIVDLPKTVVNTAFKIPGKAVTAVVGIGSLLGCIYYYLCPDKPSTLTTAVKGSMNSVRGSFSKPDQSSWKHAVGGISLFGLSGVVWYYWKAICERVTPWIASAKAKLRSWLPTGESGVGEDEPGITPTPASQSNEQAPGMFGRFRAWLPGMFSSPNPAQEGVPRGPVSEEAGQRHGSTPPPPAKNPRGPPPAKSLDLKNLDRLPPKVPKKSSTSWWGKEKAERERTAEIDRNRHKELTEQLARLEREEKPDSDRGWFRGWGTPKEWIGKAFNSLRPRGIGKDPQYLR